MRDIPMYTLTAKLVKPSSGVARLEIDTDPESALLARLFADCYNSMAAMKDIRYDCYENNSSTVNAKGSVALVFSDPDGVTILDSFPSTVSRETPTLIARDNLIDLINQWIKWLSFRRAHPEQDTFILE